MSTATPKRGAPVKVVKWASLHTFMLREGMNEADLASRMGVLPRTVGDWRRGLRCPDESGIDLIASILKCDSKDLKEDAPLKTFRRRYANSVINTQSAV